MHKSLSRGLALAAALAAATAGLVSTGNPATVSALAAGTAPFGAVTVSPSSGGGSTASVNIAPPSGAVCYGDTASGGVRWSSFLVSKSVDPATLTYGASGPVAPAGAPAGSVVTALLDTSGSAIANRTTGVTSGLLTPLSLSTFNFYPAGFLPAGEYWVGFACYGGIAGNPNTGAFTGNQTGRYFSTGLTITANTTASGGTPQISFAQGFAPAAPVLTSVTADAGQLTGNFTTSASAAAPITSLTATATPQGGGAPVTQSVTVAGSGSFTITGLTNGTTYDVKLTATNTIGSTDSNVISQLVAPPAINAPQLSLSGITGGVRAGIIAPAVEPAGATRTGYTLVVATDAALTAQVAGSPFTLAANATARDVTGLSANTLYYARVTATYAAPFVGTASATQSATALGAQVIEQEITVVRPAGALVLTQRCGVYGALPAEPASAAFPVALTAAAAVASTGAASEAPTVNGAPDPLFADYPYPLPANYPTRCGVDMGTGRLVTSGSLAGNYYTASGRLNQVTIVNTQDTDPAWTLNGTMGAFTVAGGGASFSGNFLGWTPVVSSVSAGVTGSTTYNMVVTPGGAVDPNAPGLGSARPLASSLAGQGLGITTLDARLKLLIPSTVRAGTYTGVLTLSIV